MIYKVARLRVSALPNRAIRRITGAPATTFAQFAHRERAAWMLPEGERSARVR